MEFALASDAGLLYAVGSCGYVGGLAVVDLGSQETSVLAVAHSFCGERIAVLRDASLVVVGKTGRPVPTLEPGQIIVVRTNGAILHTIPTTAEPVDLIVSL